MRGASARIFLTLFFSALLPLGCERPPKEAPSTPAQAERPEPPPVEEEHVEPSQKAEEVSVGPDVPAAAVENDLAKPSFSGDSSADFEKAFSSLKNWVRGVDGKIYAALVDLETDQFLIKESAEQAVNVASNAKVPTAAAALSLLGPAYRFKTEVFGELDASGACSRLILRGGGAPDLQTADLYRFISVLRGRGLSKVKELVVDQSLFSDDFVPPAFEQQPGEWAPFRANISALSVDQNSVTLNVVTTTEGKAARVWYDPPGVVTEKGSVKTSARGKGDEVRWSLSPDPDPQRLTSTVGGSLSVESGRRRYSRRLEDPRLAGGLVLAQLLSDAGIEVETVVLGSRKSEPRLALWYSEPLAELVRALGKDSDNFFAEMVLVALSQAEASVMDGAKSESKAGEGHPPWSSERGARVLSKWLDSLGLLTKGTVIKNGSGLFDANRYSPALLVSVLGHIEDNPRIYHDFVSHLAMGATDGTLKNRLRGSELGERVRAKTGTLRQVDALTGYIGRTSGKSPLSFSIIVQDVKASHGEVRRKVDQVVLAWAKIAD